MNAAKNSSPDVYAPPAIGREPRAVYFHVPFCLHRCGYCDFTLVARRDDLIPSYLQALENELTRLNRSYDVDTVFVGGGTPTHLSVEQLLQLGELIRKHFSLADGGEFSIEANPDGLDEGRLSALRDIGVNRVSLGVQSFDNEVLKTLERQHSAAEAEVVVERVQRFFPSVSLDLIFGVPGQNIDSWRATLTRAVRLPLKHISTYGLTFEKGTDFFQRRKSGGLIPIDDDLERTMYAEAIERLADSGFTHYEISNFARDDSRCRHNEVYWAADEYFAFGPGAARYVDGVRSTNARNVNRWITSWLNNEPALQDHETLNPKDKAREAIFLGLRLVDGFSLSQFQQRFGFSVAELSPECLQQNIDSGNLEVVGDHLRLTDQGRFIADTVISDFLG